MAGPPRRGLRVLQALLVVTIAESFVHYLDNWVRFDDYGDDPPWFTSWIQRWTIPVSWLAFTAAGMAGYRRFVRGDRPYAAAFLGAWSVSGLASALHFVDISPSELSAFQNTFVFADIALGVIVLAFACWTAAAPTAASLRTAP
jgi:hypothetical protein